MTTAEICQARNIQPAVAEHMLAYLQKLGLITGFVPGQPGADVQLCSGVIHHGHFDGQPSA